MSKSIISEIVGGEVEKLPGYSSFAQKTIEPPGNFSPVSMILLFSQMILDESFVSLLL